MDKLNVKDVDEEEPVDKRVGSKLTDELLLAVEPTLKISAEGAENDGEENPKASCKCE